MNADQWRLVKPILESALELSAADRPGFLNSACVDAFLRREVDSLLLAHDRAEPHVLNPEDELRFRLLPGKRVGVYEILEEIAQGGMGAVYRAVRADGQYTQQVALKIVRAELGGESMAARFRNERQILASLDHPNIARILDGGSTSEGLPYFAMEFIDGLPIVEYCETHKLTIDARLELIRTVCSAVHYAHQHLVIHRDIKPTNILVTSHGVPKLVDFGIAKILDPNLLPEGQSLTAAGMWPMTPEYASPEQLRGSPITTATDVYSLGLVLFELLTGQPAYRFSSRMPHEIARMVLETEPQRPSAILQRLSGDLDNIVMKALRKEPQERYSSVEQFAEDLRRHSECLPVIARKDTRGYRASKYFKRHQAGVAIAIAVAVAIIAALAFALYEAQIARVQRMRAEARFNEVRSLANSLMFDVHDAIQNLPGSTPARKLLVDRALGHLDSLARDAGSDPSLQRDLAAAYEKLGTVQGNPFGANLGDTRGALESYAKARSIRESLAKANRVEDTIALARVQRLIGAVHANRGGPDSIPELKQALETAERAARISPSSPAIWEELQGGYYLIGIVLDAFGDLRQSAEYLRKELPVAERRARATPADRGQRRELGAAEAKAGFALARLGARAEGLGHSNRAIAILEALSADAMDTESSRWLGMAHWMLGDILLMAGDATGALRNHEEQLRIVTALAAADPANAVVQYDLACSFARAGNAMTLAGRHAAGLVLLSQAATMFELQIARDPAYIEPRFGLAATFVWTGDALEGTGGIARALENYKRGLAIWEGLALNHGGTAIEADAALVHGRIGSALARSGRTVEALAEYRRALGIAEPILSSRPEIIETHYVVADLYSGLGEMEQRMRHWNEAQAWYRRSLKSWQGIANPGARTPTGLACGNPRTVARELAACDAAFASLQSGGPRKDQ